MMDRLDELIKGCEQWDEQWDNGAINELSILLTELKQRRESELRPADKFLGATANEQWEHLVSEVGESTNELVKVIDFSLKDAIPRAVEEIIDIQMSCETLIAILGLDEQQRMEARRKVVEKNRARHYYNT
jgi:vacuolar-type H+-ATPase subunit I/STV1